MAQVIINNRSVVGRSIVIVNGKVIVDGNDQTPDAKEITINITGDVENLEVDYCKALTVTGNAVDVKTTSADIEIGGYVTGSVGSTSGDVDISGDVGGSVSTVSGDVRCGSIAGSVKTVSGDIKNSK